MMATEQTPAVLLNGLKAWFSVMKIKDPSPKHWKQFLEYVEVIPTIEKDADYLHFLAELNSAECSVIHRVASGITHGDKGNETGDPAFIWFTVLAIKLMCFELNTERFDFVRNRFHWMLDAVRQEGAAASVPFDSLPDVVNSITEKNA